MQHVSLSLGGLMSSLFLSFLGLIGSSLKSYFNPIPLAVTYYNLGFILNGQSSYSIYANLYLSFS